MAESPEAGRLGCEARGHVTAMCWVPCSREWRWQQHLPHRVLSITKQGHGEGPGRGSHRGRSATAGPRSTGQPRAQASLCAGRWGPACVRHTCTRVPATAYLGGGHGHQVHPGVGFAQHVVAARGIGEDLHPIQAHVHVWAAGRGGQREETRVPSPPTQSRTSWGIFPAPG